MAFDTREARMRKEAESHSSELTNKRIDLIKSVVWQKGLGIMSMSSKSSQAAKQTLEYFSSLIELYVETPGLYDNDSIKKIEGRIKKGNIIASKMRMFGNPKPQEIENLLQISLQIQWMVNMALQNLKYFFRLGKQETRGLDAALEVFQENAWQQERSDGKIQGEAGEQPKV